jgi:hypothetical protein
VFDFVFVDFGRPDELLLGCLTLPLGQHLKVNFPALAYGLFDLQLGMQPRDFILILGESLLELCILLSQVVVFSFGLSQDIFELAL